MVLWRRPDVTRMKTVFFYFGINYPLIWVFLLHFRNKQLPEKKYAHPKSETWASVRIYLAIIGMTLFVVFEEYCKIVIVQNIFFNIILSMML